MTPSPDPTPQTDPVAVIIAIGSAIGGIFYGVWLFVNKIGNSMKPKNDEFLPVSTASRDIDRAFDFAEDYRQRLRDSEGRLEALEVALETSKLDCLQQIEAVNNQRDKQLAAVIQDYDGKIDKLTARVQELEKGNGHKQHG